MSSRNVSINLLFPRMEILSWPPWHLQISRPQSPRLCPLFCPLAPKVGFGILPTWPSKCQDDIRWLKLNLRQKLYENRKWRTFVLLRSRNFLLDLWNLFKNPHSDTKKIIICRKIFSVSYCKQRWSEKLCQVSNKLFFVELQQ